MERIQADASLRQQFQALNPHPANVTFLTFIETMHFQEPNSSPFTVDHRYSKVINTEAQPYQRRMKVTEKWQPVDMGWLEEDCGGKCSCLALFNEEGIFTRMIPTPTEVKDAKAKIIELGIEDPGLKGRILSFAQLGTQESMRFQPHDLSRLCIRCRVGEARVSLTLFPA